MRFRATLQLGGKTATGIVIPPEVVESLGAGKKPPVKVTIAGYTYEKFSYSHQLRHVLAIEEAKTEETRQRRIAKAVEMLHEG